MDNAIYAGLTRQSGLLREMRVVANNVANASTTGFRREGVVFAEHLSATGAQGRAGTLSMGLARGRVADLRQGALEATGGRFDLGIEGEGFFMLQTPDGPRLTRAGAFLSDAAGNLVNGDGHLVLDEGQAPIALPPGARAIAVGPDGTVSADGEPVGRVGVFTVPDPAALQHRGGTLFEATAAPQPAEDTRLRQGFLEGSNVDPVFEISRLIEVQRSYELGQSLLDREDERIRAVITALTR
ncbi:flagellar hook-basal body complex protein [Paracoccus sp. S-4012]|uniref:flagellar hook-basal body complex protein n=1 Tax=Paracoccus sp. S-4012 TaxID=2665648 RepID=UPI0012B0C880|nr:flagellar hook-basal body complex protein [Paracoccus sp. S-4012]MRX49246.1 flagellar hook-basal body complex protein [Paracoccus sp. S-4012]